ncbi:MAG TPA: molybdopterin-dependent oxidoreductase [Solirubrobacteraceae bacterium]|nr:molybdopterin-dependent oxidoreductase [Solirubrobacteraceae bacterium]
MPRPAPNTITFTIDGREVQAPENSMLVDAAKHGDVEIPVFCYEPKLGNPVGACRMCLVEIEGIGKLQTGCSTPVKDGMVVNTQSDRVKEAQRSVVEFLLINHPLDCPVCDKGGECPLQDITFGWGGGISRFIEPKRHFVKPLELSPKIAIDRERCILCYRCVRFSQEIAEDYQLVLLERGAHSFVSTFDGHPYVAPFSGNIIELCPVGALTSRSYRFRARPWDIEDAGTVCTLCPAQCNVSLTVRDERVLRVLSRQNDDVDDGWLCDHGRFAYPALAQGEGPSETGSSTVKVLQGNPAAAANGDARGIRVGMRVSRPLLRDGGELRPVSWERAIEEAAVMLGRSGAKTAALAGDGATNEEGFLLSRLLGETLGSPHIDSRPSGTLAPELQRELAEPRLQAKVSDLEFAHGVLLLDCDPLLDAPILDLRLRKGVRRHGMKLERVSGEDFGAVRETAKRLADVGEEVVIVWGERFAAGADGAGRVRSLLDLAAELSLGETDGAGLLEIPATSNGRGLREAGVLPNGGPGFSEREQDGLDARAIADALAGGELSALYLFEVDPLSDGDPFAAAAGARADVETGEGSASWARGMERASAVVAHATLLSAGLAEHANVIFPAGSYAEKEGTVTHPDGRLQRVRQAVAEAGDTRPGWRVIAELSLRLGTDLDVYDAKEASQQLFDAVPFYAEMTLDEIGGRGVRWQEREETVAVGNAVLPQQMEPSAEAHSGPDRDTHAADNDTEGEHSTTGELPHADDGENEGEGRR